MRLQIPDDEVTPGVLLSIPHEPSHQLCPYPASHTNIRSPLLPPDTKYADDIPIFTEQDLREYWQQCRMEVVVVVEGADPFTGDELQARHSYKEFDILWDHAYQNCLLPPEDEDGTAILDFELFHKMRPLFGDAKRRQPTPNADLASRHAAAALRDESKGPNLSLSLSRTPIITLHASSSNSAASRATFTEIELDSANTSATVHAQASPVENDMDTPDDPSDTVSNNSGELEYPQIPDTGQESTTSQTAQYDEKE
jgi:Inward rectifier potassium channel C-terminal domain